MTTKQENPRKRLAILGSTGSIGVQTLEIVRENPDLFEVEVLIAGNQADALIAQAVEFKPNVVVIANEDLHVKVKQALDPLDIKVYAGTKACTSVLENEHIDMVVTAVVGFAGLEPTLKSISAGKQIALANKETLVVAGELVTKLAAEKGVNLYPVDSEHSAIFQCLAGEWQNPIEKIILTASGGPFRGKTKSDLAHVTKAQALKHPNWSMGAKITIDSATLMNKGLEVIEAKWLFHLTPEQIEVVVHPQSIIHSLVQFQDGSIKAQLGLPDMKLPILYAIGFPKRIATDWPRFDFMAYPSLTFQEPDKETFVNLQLAYDAMAQGGNAACILNAANEIAVDAFLRDEIGFLDIATLNAWCMQHVAYQANPDLKVYLETDAATRSKAREWVKQRMLVA